VLRVSDFVAYYYFWFSLAAAVAAAVATTITTSDAFLANYKAMNEKKH
jgi:hypothetical protein